jgi:hypothetical protein
MEQAKRGATLTVFAILFAIVAISNLLKPFHLEGSTTGFVFFGTRTAGIWNDILGPAFGIFLLVYAIGIWQMKRYALPLGCLYAAYVILNIVLYSAKNRGEAHPPSPGFMIAYIVLAVGISSASALILIRRRADLIM